MTEKEIAEGFSSHQFEIAIPYLQDDVQWNLVGGERLIGKAKVVEYCRQSASYLAGVTITFKKFQVVLADKAVIIESQAEYKESESASVVASCDLYRFKDGKVFEITSYNIELKT